MQGQLQIYKNKSIESIVRLQTPNDVPYYLVNTREIHELYRLWKKELPHIHPYYAVKCNTNSVLLKTLSALQVHFDCASKAEMDMILSLTQNPRRIIYANPCKTPSYIEYARQNEIQRMTADCEEELRKIYRYYPEAHILLRIAVDDSDSKCPFSKKFGCLPTDIAYLLQIAGELSLHIVGFSFHIGSGCQNPQKFRDAIIECRKAIDLASSSADIRVIDIGGGFQKSNFKETALVIRDTIMQCFSDLPQMEWMAEPGRFFAETTHTYVLQVIGKRLNRDGKRIFYINDGIYGSLNCLLFDHWKPVFRTLKEDDTKVASIVFGPTCDSIDLIGEDIMMPESLTVGDVIYIEDFGAYSISASSQFNGFPLPESRYIYIEN
jgi:ornithine decarboxylase